MHILRYDALIENVKSLSTEEKEELRFLTEKYLIEEQRENIYKNYKNSLKENKRRKPEFSNNLNRLKKMIGK